MKTESVSTPKQDSLGDGGAAKLGIPVTAWFSGDFVPAITGIYQRLYRGKT
jgi:hypothetical protein